MLVQDTNAAAAGIEDGSASANTTRMVDLLLTEKFLQEMGQPSAQQQPSFRSTHAWERRYLCKHILRQPHLGADCLHRISLRSGPHTLNLSGAHLYTLNGLQQFGLQHISPKDVAVDESKARLDGRNTPADAHEGPGMRSDTVEMRQACRKEITKVNLQCNHLRSLQQLCVAPLSREALNQRGASAGGDEEARHTDSAQPRG